MRRDGPARRHPATACAARGSCCRALIVGCRDRCRCSSCRAWTARSCQPLAIGLRWPLLGIAMIVALHRHPRPRAAAPAAQGDTATASDPPPVARIARRGTPSAGTRVAGRARLDRRALVAVVRRASARSRRSRWATAAAARRFKERDLLDPGRVAPPGHLARRDEPHHRAGQPTSCAPSPGSRRRRPRRPRDHRRTRSSDVNGERALGDASSDDADYDATVDDDAARSSTVIPVSRTDVHDVPRATARATCAGRRQERDVEVRVYGEDLEILREKADEVQRRDGRRSTASSSRASSEDLVRADARDRGRPRRRRSSSASSPATCAGRPRRCCRASRSATCSRSRRSSRSSSRAPQRPATASTDVENLAHRHARTAATCGSATSPTCASAPNPARRSSTTTSQRRIDVDRRRAGPRASPTSRPTCEQRLAEVAVPARVPRRGPRRATASSRPQPA